VAYIRLASYTFGLFLPFLHTYIAAFQNEANFALANQMTPQTFLAYQDHPLDFSRRDIRLLHLHPRTTEHVSAELRVVNLADAIGTYACVSYVWGDAKKTVQIQVDGQELQVTTNLFDFLYHIRDLHNTVILWVDAICMNQNDLSEKSHQVGMMGEIYSGCSNVHVWLGMSTDPLVPKTSPFAMIEHFADKKHYHDLPGHSRDEDGKWCF
jgi:hypothetical protein